MKKGISVSLLVVMLITLLAGCGGSATDDYHNKIYEFQMLSLIGAARAEKVGNMVMSVWHDTIYEEFNDETFPYTQDSNYKYNEDFNISLANYFASDDYKDAKSAIDSNIAEVDKKYLELTNPPISAEEGFSIVKTMYENYDRLVSLALAPSGSYKSYSADIGEADSGFINAYKKIDRYFEAIEFDPTAD